MELYRSESECLEKNGGWWNSVAPNQN